MKILLINPSLDAVELFKRSYTPFNLVVSKEYNPTYSYSLVVFSVSYPYQIVNYLREWKECGLKLPFVFFTEYQNAKLLKAIFPKLVFLTSYTSESEVPRICEEVTVKEPCLTVREKEVLYGCMKGKSAISICEDLQISSNTFYMHKKNLLRKLGLTSTQQLIVYGVVELFTRTQHS